MSGKAAISLDEMPTVIHSTEEVVSLGEVAIIGHSAVHEGGLARGLAPSKADPSMDKGIVQQQLSKEASQAAHGTDSLYKAHTKPKTWGDKALKCLAYLLGIAAGVCMIAFGSPIIAIGGVIILFILFVLNAIDCD